MKIKWNSDKMIGLSAMLISLLTFVIFLYQTSIIRKQSRLSVTPRFTLEEEVNIGEDSTFTFRTVLANKGVGPGIVESVKILYNGKVFDGNFYGFITDEISKRKGSEKVVQTGGVGKAAVLQSNESYVLYKIKGAQSKMGEILKHYRTGDGQVVYNVEVIYSSMYEEKWRIRQNDFDHPVVLD